MSLQRPRPRSAHTVTLIRFTNPLSMYAHAIAITAVPMSPDRIMKVRIAFPSEIISSEASAWRIARAHTVGVGGGSPRYAGPACACCSHTATPLSHRPLKPLEPKCPRSSPSISSLARCLRIGRTTDRCASVGLFSTSRVVTDPTSAAQPSSTAAHCSVRPGQSLSLSPRKNVQRTLMF